MRCRPVAASSGSTDWTHVWVLGARPRKRNTGSGRVRIQTRRARPYLGWRQAGQRTGARCLLKPTSLPSERIRPVTELASVVCPQTDYLAPRHVLVQFLDQARTLCLKRTRAAPARAGPVSGLARVWWASIKALQRKPFFSSKLRQSRVRCYGGYSLQCPLTHRRVRSALSSTVFSRHAPVRSEEVVQFLDNLFEGHLAPAAAGPVGTRCPIPGQCVRRVSCSARASPVTGLARRCVAAAVPVAPTLFGVPK